MKTNIGQKMYDLGYELLNTRFGDNEGGVGIIRTSDDTYYTSVWNETINSAVDLCAETGAILEAHKYNKTVTHSMCIVRNENGNIDILSPCGVCQERLFFWGTDVMCAVTNPKNKIIFKKLKELQPFYWKK